MPSSPVLPSPPGLLRSIGPSPRFFEDFNLVGPFFFDFQLSSLIIGLDLCPSPNCQRGRRLPFRSLLKSTFLPIFFFFSSIAISCARCLRSGVSPSFLLASFVHSHATSGMPGTFPAVVFMPKGLRHCSFFSPPPHPTLSSISIPKNAFISVLLIQTSDGCPLYRRLTSAHELSPFFAKELLVPPFFSSPI